MKKAAKGEVKQTTVEAVANMEVPTGDDFFGIDSKADVAAMEASMAAHVPKQQFYV